jgi:DNA-binding LytR/AlgR family response regulator
MLNFVLCDDNKSNLDRLAKILESIFIKNNIDAEVTYTSTTPEDILNYMNSNSVNVLFLDIDLKSETSGIDLANQIRKYNKEVYIIFTSAHLEYILIAYKCKTFDFIPKPLSTERVEETILRLIDDINSATKQTTFIRIDNKNTIINQDKVNFIKKDGMKLVFYTDTRTYETYSSFNKISNVLPDNFIRCHKSYIANVNKISNIKTNDNTIIFENKKDSDMKCYIGPKYKNKFMEVLKNGNFTINLDSINNGK